MELGRNSRQIFEFKRVAAKVFQNQSLSAGKRALRGLSAWQTQERAPGIAIKLNYQRVTGPVWGHGRLGVTSGSGHTSGLHQVRHQYRTGWEGGL